MNSRFLFQPAAHVSESQVCRAMGCGRNAESHDDFCVKCREEIDAVRADARRAFVIWGTSGSLIRGRDVQPWSDRLR